MKKKYHVYKAIGSALRTIRKEQGETLRDIAAEAGISKSFLSELERGNKNPSLGTLGKIAKCLKVGVQIDFIDVPCLQNTR